jgi:catechol 2,3-dioxygenase-like lactoylglutathione lyase family enzyme
MEILGSRILLRPRDFARSRAFYREVIGLHIYREFAGGRGVVFFLGGGFLELSGASADPATATVQIWMQVRSVDDAYQRLRDAVTITEPPADKPWGLRELRILDPDGVQIVFVEVPAGHPLRTDTR